MRELPPAKNPLVSLRRMLRWERRISWAATVWWFTLVTVCAASIVAGAGTDLYMLACAGFIVFFFVLAIAIGLGVFSSRYDSVTTWRQIHYTLDSLGDVNELLDQIDNELAGREAELFGPVPTRYRGQTRGSLILTQSWVLWFGWDGFRFFPIPRMVWLYKRIEVSAAWWGVSDHRRIELACVTRANTLLTLQMTDEDFLDEAIEILIRKRPEALFGFRAEWIELAKKSISPVLDEVARRRAAWEKASSEERAEWRNDCLADARHFVRRVDSTTEQNATEY
jgi:hypothetical protein